MNRLKIIIKIAILPILLFACDKIYLENPEDLNYFMKLYGTYYSDNLTDIKITQNEEIFLTGYRLNADSKEESWLIKTDANGMVDWEKVIKSNSNCRGYGLYIGETILYAGYKKIDNAAIQKGFIIEYNMDNNQLDSIPFDIQADEVKDIKFISKTSDIKFLVHLERNNQDEIIIYKYDKLAGITELSVNQLYAVIQDRLYYFEQDDGSLFISGTTKEVNSEVNTDIMIARLDNDNITWSYNYGKPDILEESSGIIVIDDKLYVASNDVGENTNHINILKLNQSGIEESVINVGLVGKYTSYEMILNTQGEFVFVGEKVETSNDVKMFMSRVSFDGNVLQENEYGYAGLCQGRFVLNLPGNNKGFLIAGNLFASSNTESKDVVDVIVVKVNELGEWIY